MYRICRLTNSEIEYMNKNNKSVWRAGTPRCHLNLPIVVNKIKEKELKRSPRESPGVHEISPMSFLWRSLDIIMNYGENGLQDTQVS